MASDIKFSAVDSSFSIWLRSPKVSSRLGDIVEVWQVENKRLDPVAALKAYLERRRVLFGPSGDLPAFLHENGALHSRAEFNSDLKKQLDVFPHQGMILGQGIHLDLGWQPC